MKPYVVERKQKPKERKKEEREREREREKRNRNLALLDEEQVDQEGGVADGQRHVGQSARRADQFLQDLHLQRRPAVGAACNVRNAHKPPKQTNKQT